MKGGGPAPVFLELNNHSAPSFAANVCKRGTMGQPLFFGARQSLSSIFCSKSVEVKGGGPAPVCWSSTISLTHYLQQKSAGEGSWASPCFFWSARITVIHHLQMCARPSLFVRHTCKNVSRKHTRVGELSIFSSSLFQNPVQMGKLQWCQHVSPQWNQ